MRKRAKQRMGLVVTFAVVAAMLSAVVAVWQTHEYDTKRLHYQSIAESRVNIMLDNVDRVAYSAHVLEALVIENDGDTSFFKKQAPIIYQQAIEASGVELRNIALAPNGVVSDVHPAENNKSLIGFDFFDESKPGNEAAIEARDTGSMVITNPFTLMQGGKAIGSRQPISLPNDKGIGSRMPISTYKGGEECFWGLVTVTMDFDDLIKMLHLETLTTNDANYRLWYTDGNGKEATISASEALPENPETKTMSTMGINWNLDVSPSEGWVNWKSVASAEAIALIIAALIAFLGFEHFRLKRANEMLRRLANLDSLTSCYSRHYVNTILINQLTGEWNDPQSKYSLIVVDIDRFKSINDTYGHDVGDEAIKSIARVLMDNCCAEDGDCVIRHGGDEFVIVYNDVTLKRFRDKLDTISQQVRELRLETNPDIRLTVSMGAEYYQNKEVSRYYDMLKRADDKLYEAKDGGRDAIAM